MKRLEAMIGALVVVAVAGAGAACTPDTTRARIEGEVPGSFAHAFVLSERLQGHDPTTPDVTSAECHSSVNTAQDSGPGSWDCELGYTVAGRRQQVNLLVLVDSTGCYQAMNTDQRNQTIHDVGTGQVVPDPKVGFDGCFDVFDNRTSVDKDAPASQG